MIKTLKTALICLSLFIGTKSAFADDYPSILLKNKKMEVLIFLPNKTNSYYQAARFDWGSMVVQITYKGHTYLQQWKGYNGRGKYGVHNPMTPNTGTGLAEEFTAALGFDDADLQGKFVKIGVGVLQKVDQKEYNFSTPYTIVEPGKYTYKSTASSLTYTQELNTKLGYSYILERTYELVDNTLLVKHRLKNTGEKQILTETYSHNFMQFDYGAFNPDFSLYFLNGAINPLNCKLESPKKVQLFETKVDIIQEFPDYSPCFGMLDLKVKKGDFKLQNNKTGMSATMQLDRDASSFALWMWQKSFCGEPRIQIDLPPNQETTWTSTYTFTN
jgi:hypothetical protein